MLIIIKNDEFFAGVEYGTPIWTPIRFLAQFPCQIVLYPTRDMAEEDRENLDVEGEIVPLAQILGLDMVLP